MRDSETYNGDQIDRGLLSLQYITQLVECYQEQHGLKVDGYCGPNTLSALEAENAPLAGVSNLAGAALQVARESLGQGETGGNNSGPFVESLHLKKYDGDTDDDGAWCAAFVSWCYEQAAERLDVEVPFLRSGGAKTLFKRVTAVGRSSLMSTDDVDTVRASVKPGDVVCWHRGDPTSWTGHIGFVERIEGDVIHTIEGNVGRYPSKVRRFRRDLAADSLIGFARV